MGFFYLSIFSLIFIAIVYALVLWLFWFLWVRIYKRRFSGPVVWSVVALVLIAPWLEEIWIAWNFGQQCRKDAGVSIYKTVEVEGYFDDTSAGGRDRVSQYGFKWIEGRDRTVFEKTYWRHEWDGQGVRSYKIDRPTARYHYTTNLYGEKVAHKIIRVESQVIDTYSGEVIGRYVGYGRGPYWFYISMGTPPYSCDGPDGGPTSRYNRLIYRDVLKPVK